MNVTYNSLPGDSCVAGRGAPVRPPGGLESRSLLTFLVSSLIGFYGVQVSRTISSFVTIKSFWGDVSPALSLSLSDFWGMVPLTVTQ